MKCRFQARRGASSPLGQQISRDGPDKGVPAHRNPGSGGNGVPSPCLGLPALTGRRVGRRAMPPPGLRAAGMPQPSLPGGRHGLRPAPARPRSHFPFPSSLKIRPARRAGAPPRRGDINPSGTSRPNAAFGRRTMREQHRNPTGNGRGRARGSVTINPTVPRGQGLSSPSPAAKPCRASVAFPPPGPEGGGFPPDHLHCSPGFAVPRRLNWEPAGLGDWDGAGR